MEELIKKQIKANSPENTINPEASARVKPMEDDHPRLDSMEDFPELQP